jgi:hypothetical protein
MRKFADVLFRIAPPYNYLPIYHGYMFAAY